MVEGSASVLERDGTLDGRTVTMSRRLRIAMMLESDGPGGAEMMMFRLSEELRERGHSIVPVGPAKGIGWLGDLFRGVGVSPEVFHIRRALDPACLRDLVRLLREQRIDAVHSHEFTMAVYGAAACRLLGLPQVITMHGGLKVCKALRRRVALRWAIRNSGHTVMVSRATGRKFAEDLGLEETHFTVVPNGVPVRAGNATRVRAEFGIQPGDCVLLAVGTLERHKGHGILLEALARLTSRGQGGAWKLIIAGGRGGDQHESLMQFVQEEGLEDRVHIVTNRNDIPDLLELADIFVMPSLFEGLPMALLEAMTAGKAIIASATSGIPEAVVDGREGLLVRPGDVASLSEALRSLLTDPVRRRTLGAAAATRAHEEFTVQVMAERYENLYTNALSSARRRVPVNA
jgi:glycosyltransferase involved in cell wall biosynthesis